MSESKKVEKGEAPLIRVQLPHQAPETRGQTPILKVQLPTPKKEKE